MVQINEALETVKGEDRSYSQGQLIRRRFLRHKVAMSALIVFFIAIVLAYTSIGFGPIPGWWGKDYASTYPKVGNGEPTISLTEFTIGEHPFGQDTIGKDYFALVMRGMQRSLMIAFGIGIISTIIGTIVGLLAGYYRGWVEAVLMRLTDFVIVVPTLVFAAILSQMAGGVVGMTLVLPLVLWTSLARLVRGEVLSLREREFVVAARVSGASDLRVIVRHILPGTVGVIVVAITLAIGAAILLESTLTFLGFGVSPPDTSLGLLISDYQNAFTTRPWLFWFPGLAILTIVLCVNFIGDGLRDAFDPRQTRSKD
ncbi:ABC transporter permease [Phytoactinopolyspora halotolerans]|uniref:ABC transporter permease n=1 Tax=Phytoactinopolyspora halotolerans TaxID=1981512 RepID=UPI001C20A032|nr:ABC transporter permease [Phytoactinopolyspora halotolerans]